MNKKILVLLVIIIIAILAIAVIAIKQNHSKNQEITKQELLQKFQTLKTQYEQAKTQGVDVSEIEKLGLEAKQAFDNGDYKTANELLDKAKSALEEIKTSKTSPIPAPSTPPATTSTPATPAPETLNETIVIAGIPQMNMPKAGTVKPSWKEVEGALPELKETGANTIFIWTPYDAIWPEAGRTIPVKTEKGIENMEIKDTFIVKDYLKPDSERGTEEEFLHMVQTAHSLGMKVIAQLQITVTAPGTFVYDNHPEWMLKSIYREPAIFWPWPLAQYGYVVNKDNPELIKYVTETVLPHWVKKWGVDGIYLDSAMMAYCNSYIKDLCDKTGYAKGFECLTPVDGYYSPEPLANAMREKIEQLGKETEKNLAFASEITWKSTRDMPDDLIMKTCKGDISGWYVDPRVDRTIGKYFDWVQGYNFRSLLKLVYGGTGYSYSENYVKAFKLTQQEEKYTKTAKFVNTWVEANKFVDLLKPDVSNAYLTLAITAPGNIIWIGEYQIILAEEVGEKLFGYNADSLKNQYKKLIMIKKTLPSLQSDNIEDALVSPKVKKLIAYNRWSENESATVIVNAGDKSVDAIVKTKFGGDAITVYDLLYNETFAGNSSELKVHMPAYGSRILIVN
ncbi:hypothetical protein KKE99_00705 [Patescibacteria group bacterium]|nr:hypothetical protein [Patescibacteria group bacterium]